MDKNGEPMVVYHGTTEKFNAFETSSHGMHFGSIKSAQERLSDKRLELRSSSKGNVLGVFLNIRNPEDTTDQDTAWGYEVKYAKLRGADGLRYTNRWEDKGSTSYVAFYPNQIKSATENVGTFDENTDDIRFRISNDHQRVFVSNAERAVEGIKQEKATPQQWLAMIEKQGGIKAGEDKWLGLSEWLKAQDKKTLTKQEILDFIAENQIQIEEVEYGEYDMQSVFVGYRREYKQYYDEAVADNAEDPQEDAWQRMIEEHGEDFSMGFYAYG